MKNAKDYVSSVKLDLFSDQVFAFTPNGDIYDFPKDATCVDFAYRIHSDVGHKTVGALINGRIVPLNTKLNNGDIVEVLTSKTPAPRLDWLTFVVTKQASSKIKQWFKKNNREEHINLGKTNLEHELTKSVFDEYVKSGEFEKIAKTMNYQSADDLFAALGYGETTANKITNKLKKPEEKHLEDTFKKYSKSGTKKDIIGLEGLLYSFARLAVIKEPLLMSASTTSVPTDNAATILFLSGKLYAIGANPTGNSLITIPVFKILSISTLFVLG